jgi:hydroxymethylglutaryl-CoA reductase
VKNGKMQRNYNSFKKFYELDLDERLDYIQNETKIKKKDLQLLKDLPKNFSFNKINNMVENAIGIIPIPLGIATNFVINGKKYLIPVSIEEPSVIAAASNAAKIAKMGGGFIAEADESIMIGQIQLVARKRNHKDLFASKKERERVKKIITENKEELLKIANLRSRTVVAKDIQVREILDESINNMGYMIIIELIVDTKDAMGANVINTMCESIAPKIEKLSNGEVVLKILSNYSVNRLARCKATFPKEMIGGSEGVNRILLAYAFAYSDTFRAVTHNKGIMNGIDALAIATGQDFRALEASIHAYAARDGKYRSLTKWYKSKDGDLIGEIEIPMAIGIIGGIVSVHPIVKVVLNILDIKNVKELASIFVAIGLAQNFAAIRALANEGIQKGHMKLHARNIALTAGAEENQVYLIAERLIKEKNVSVSKAKEIIELLNSNRI